MNRHLWGPYPPKKNLYNSFDRDENLHTYVKSKIKWGNCTELFPTEKVKKGGLSTKLQRVSFFNLILVFELDKFFNAFLSKK